jgi:serine/threonine protein kinase
MMLNADLHAWGELPAEPREGVLADFLDTVLEKLQAGEPVQTGLLLRASPELVEQGQRLLHQVEQLCRSASTVWKHSGLFGLAPVPPSQFAAGQETTSAEVSLPDPFPGEFRVRRLLGSGSFGAVWLADDLNLGRPVALKTLRPQGRTDPEALPLKALRHEACLLAALNHPHLVRVYAWRQAADEHYLVLHYVAGGSLEGRLQREGPLPWQVAARYITDVADGLLEAHRHGIVHRDVKPANILWDSRTDEALLTDFGIAARLADASSVAGSPLYMPPEAFHGQVTPALDVYSLAATFFRLVTGAAPFPAESVDDLCRQIQQGLPDPDPRCMSLPDDLERIIRAGLAAEVEHRPDLRAFVAALRGSLNQLMADTMTLRPGRASHPASVDLRLLVSKTRDGRTFEPVAASHPPAAHLMRDLQRVPQAPDQLRLRTGDRVRIEVVASRPGAVTVFNVGPTGNLNLLYPAEPAAAPLIGANQPLHILDVELRPPAGRERLIALWSRVPLPLRLEELLSLASGAATPAPYRATRDLKRVHDTLQRQQPEEWHAVVLELDHCLPQEHE